MALKFGSVNSSMEFSNPAANRRAA